MHYETKSILDKIKRFYYFGQQKRAEQEYANVYAIPENLLDAEMIVSALRQEIAKLFFI